MGALPKRRISTRRQGKRRASISLSLPTLNKCPKCGRSKISHCSCPGCGTYKANENGV